MTHHNKSLGNTAEKLVLENLRSKGALCEIIETKMRLGRVGGRAILIPDSGSKLGDIYGMWNRQGLLVEVKNHPDDKLQYSILQKHQHENMRNWIDHSGKALVAWVRNGQIFMFDYPTNWIPRISIKWEVPCA